MAVSHKPHEFRVVVKELEEKFLPYHLGEKVYEKEPVGFTREYQTEEISYNLNLPPWLCQPVSVLSSKKFNNEATTTKYSSHLQYIRLEPNEHIRIQAEKFRKAEDPATVKREFFDLDGNKISRKLSKKLKRINRRPTHRTCTTKVQRNLELCSIDLINPVVIAFIQHFLQIFRGKFQFLILRKG